MPFGSGYAGLGLGSIAVRRMLDGPFLLPGLLLVGMTLLGGITLVLLNLHNDADEQEHSDRHHNWFRLTARDDEKGRPTLPPRQSDPMPQVLNIRHLPGFSERRPIVPPNTVYLGQSFASLGAIPGTYTWTWGTGADADSFTLQIGPAAAPEPASLTLLALGLAGLGMVLRTRRA